MWLCFLIRGSAIGNSRVPLVLFPYFQLSTPNFLYLVSRVGCVGLELYAMFHELQSCKPSISRQALAGAFFWALTTSTSAKLEATRMNQTTTSFCTPSEVHGSSEPSQRLLDALTRRLLTGNSTPSFLLFSRT
jgi:hypothetical protein